MGDDVSLAARLADAAQRVTDSLTETRYTGKGRIDARAGIFDVDCSEYVTYLLNTIARRHLDGIPVDEDRGRRLAGNFYTFAHSLPFTLRQGWRQVERLTDAVRGDIVAWQHHDRANDSGHVFVVAAPAVAAGDMLSVAVYDSSNVRHFDDSRGPSGRFRDGVGTGSIHFRVDDRGVPVGFMFGQGDHIYPAPIAIARIEPFSAG